EVYFDQDKTRLFGEIGYFNYFFNYYGQGVDSKADDLEIYNANFPRAIVSALRRVSSKWYVGGQYIFDNYNINDVVAGSNVDRARGSSGGVVSSIGAEILYDGRDQLIYPSKGSFLNVKSEVSSKITGATYQYQKLELDFRNYTSVTKGHVIASNVYMGLSFNEIPFFQQYFISSGTKLRGFNDRRFQDNNVVLFQTEYRYPIYKRLGGVAFYGVGTLNNKVENLLRGPYKQSGGLGLRFLLNKRDLINLRLDYAFTNEGGNFYATVKEAF
ncbi:MAG TPA: BamA/TamA family outer membrane protein, partial [Saprospiraceae bacterium]|nr:BamA/TamA family outer membrane protein [Saprospiraceae bacterium]